MEEEAEKLNSCRVFMQGEAVCLGALFHADNAPTRPKLMPKSAAVVTSHRGTLPSAVAGNVMFGYAIRNNNACEVEKANFSHISHMEAQLSG